MKVRHTGICRLGPGPDRTNPWPYVLRPGCALPKVTLLCKTVILFRLCLAWRDSILQAAPDAILRTEDGPAPGWTCERCHLSCTSHMAQSDKWLIPGSRRKASPLIIFTGGCEQGPYEHKGIFLKNHIRKFRLENLLDTSDQRYRHCSGLLTSQCVVERLVQGNARMSQGPQLDSVPTVHTASLSCS